MDCRKPLTIAGSDYHLIKLYFEEIFERDIDNLEGGKREGCEAKRPECQSGAQLECESMGPGPR